MPMRDEVPQAHRIGADTHDWSQVTPAVSKKPVLQRLDQNMATFMFLPRTVLKAQRQVSENS
jgi:hypothetical protein